MRAASLQTLGHGLPPAESQVPGQQFAQRACPVYNVISALRVENLFTPSTLTTCSAHTDGVAIKPIDLYAST